MVTADRNESTLVTRSRQLNITADETCHDVVFLCSKFFALRLLLLLMVECMHSQGITYTASVSLRTYV